MNDETIKKSQADYYGDLFKKFNYSPEAVASGKQIYKDLRYEKLSKLFGDDKEFSIHDVGMGLGHYYEFLRRRFPDKIIFYSGSEVVENFYTFCRDKYPGSQFYLRDLSLRPHEDTYDYLIFGGTFYHMCGIPRKEWEQYIFKIIRNAFSMAKKGIAFNFITEFCDFYDKELYYCNIQKLLNFITDDLSRFFMIDHAYPLYELTVYVYKEVIVKDNYREEEFKKYFKI
jgi:hypothetical protein